MRAMLPLYRKSVSLLKRYKNEEDGNFAMMAATMSLMLVMTTGSAIEIMRIQSAKSKVQTLADNMGLVAAIYIRDHETPPTDSTTGYTEGTAYSIEEINHGKPLSNVAGNFVVKYNDELKQAEVKFVGKASTGFLAAFHKPEFDLLANSYVKYPSTAKAAVSVALIVDNSGSMAWDDKPIRGNSRQNGTVSRITALKNTAKTFNKNLHEALEGKNNSQERFLRMGMIPYSTDVIQSRVQDMNWGKLDDDDITSMNASGGTDTRGPLNVSLNWMKDEDATHKFESGEIPKKYVVLMSDGSNNNEWVCDWQQRRRTRLWRKYNGFRYDYVRSNRSPGSGWEEGIAYNCKLENKSNSDSLKVCNDLKAENVEIFTIGFALEPGKYYANYGQSFHTTTISKETTDSAFNFLRSCASTEENFIPAADADALEEAFEKIGKKIVEDTIRISG